MEKGLLGRGGNEDGKAQDHAEMPEAMRMNTAGGEVIVELEERFFIRKVPQQTKSSDSARAVNLERWSSFGFMATW
eukprot:767721-Hanusia_phi.AAC.3